MLFKVIDHGANRKRLC